ncbi:MAG: GDYXXLXY domain-containing protein [Kiritimatiellae bacterium]|nr:GDYXXLXY domain-containing protein [Kiritimatiellia bacterium]
MKTKAWIGWAAAALAVQLAALGWLVACHERVVQKGEEVRIPCGAFDPSEPLRGRYLNVRAELECRDIESDTPLDEMDREARRRLCRKLVAKLEPAGDGTATHRVARLAMHPDGDGLWVKPPHGYLGSDDQGWVARVAFPGKLFMDERLAPQADRLFAGRGEETEAVAVYRAWKGKIVIADVELDGVSIRELARRARDEASGGDPEREEAATAGEEG